MKQYGLDDPLNLLGGLRPPIRSSQLDSLALEPEFVMVISCLFINRAHRGPLTRRRAYVDLINRYRRPNELASFRVLKVYGVAGTPCYDLHQPINALLHKFKQQDNLAFRVGTPRYMGLEVRYDEIRQRLLPPREIFRARKILADWLAENQLPATGLLIPLKRLKDIGTTGGSNDAVFSA